MGLGQCTGPGRTVRPARPRGTMVDVAFSSEVIELELDGRVATLWLDRAAQRNALGRAAWRDLPLAVAAATRETSVRCVVLAARGRDFTVGLDLKESDGVLVPGPSTGRHLYESIREMQASVDSLAAARVPVIAAVHGYCLGGGIDIICACDVRLAAADATFSVRETRVAIVADLGTLQRLPRIVGPGHAAELALTGRDIDAARAAQIGLVNHVVDGGAAEVYAAARAMAEEIASLSPRAVRGTKAVLAANDGASVAEGLEFVARWNAEHLYSDDLTEAMTAFVERRPAEFADPPD
jgi:Delta3,5-Delta2,4-dienoyl-CoA isomerase